MTTATREIIVYNSDPSIEHSLSPPWASPVESSPGNLIAPTLSPKLLEIYSNESLEFKFNGTQISLFGGTQDTENIWTCFVDDIPSKQSIVNNGEFCHVQGLENEPHVLTLNATRGHEGQLFWVDYISYTPLESVSPDIFSSIRVSNVDPHISFSSGWAPGDEYNITSKAGSWMSFDFIGQSLSWYGDINYTNIPPIGSYVVDDQASLPIPTLLGLGSIPGQYQPLFEIHNLSSGRHSIRATFNGSQTSTPLTLSFLLVRNGTVVDSIHSPKVNIGAIVGGSLAAILLLLLLVFLFIRYRKQTRKTRTVTLRPFFSKSVTDKVNTQPVYHSMGPRQSYQPANTYHDEIDEKSPYYGGYQTWGQIKAIEAGSKSNIRDSYI